MEFEFEKGRCQITLTDTEYWLIYSSFNEVLNGFRLENFKKKIGESKAYVETLYQTIVDQRGDLKKGKKRRWKIILGNEKDLGIIFNIFQENWIYFPPGDPEMEIRLESTHSEYRRMMDEFAAALKK